MWQKVVVAYLRHCRCPVEPAKTPVRHWTLKLLGRKMLPSTIPYITAHFFLHCLTIKYGPDRLSRNDDN
jgi:hypothetical protein